MINTSIEYIGDVKITVSRKSYKYKNSGTSRLFEYFGRWLAGQTLYQDSILPKKIRITNDTTSDMTSTTEVLTRSDINVTAQYRTTENGPATVITAVIFDSNIQPLTKDSNYYMHLKNSTNEDLAIISISNDILEQVATGRQALIEWTMRISNREVTANG